MKYSLVCVFFLLGLFSCNNPRVSDNDRFIVGKWRLFKTVVFQNNDDSAGVACNACPEITFVKNHAGFIKRPGKILFYFNWEFDGSRLYIKQTDPAAHHTLNDILNEGTYKVTYSRQFQETALFDSLKNTKYVLRR